LEDQGSVELATLHWVSWFNSQRVMVPLGFVPPAEFEATYYRLPAQQATSA
jgi:putative transposase